MSSISCFITNSKQIQAMNNDQYKHVLTYTGQILGLRPANETALLCNDVCYWLGANLESPLLQYSTFSAIRDSLWDIYNKKCIIKLLMKCFVKDNNDCSFYTCGLIELLEYLNAFRVSIRI